MLDLGSSSARISLYDAAGNCLPGSLQREACEFHIDAHGASVDDAVAAWARVLRLCAALERYCDAHAIAHIDAVAVSCYAYSLLGIDARDQPVTPVYTYADTRAAAAAETLRAQYEELDTLRRTGARIRSNYAPARIAWLRAADPALHARVRRWASLPDFLAFQATGSWSASISTAAWTGLIDSNAQDWDVAWRAALGLGAHSLPPLDAAGILITAASPLAQFPAFIGARWMPALGDGAAANIGSGCDTPARIAVTVGTTAAMRIVTPASLRTESNPALWRYAVDPARALVGGALTEGGNLVSWLRATLALHSVDDAGLAAQVEAIAPDAHGLTVLPMLAGERSPGYHETARATIHGISADTTPFEIYRAGLESLAYRLCLICDALRPYAAPGAELIGSGGALLALPMLAQMIADVSGLPLRMCEEPEATSRGAALVALGVSPPAALGAPLRPDPARHTIYRAAMARQQALYRALF